MTTNFFSGKAFSLDLVLFKIKVLYLKALKCLQNTICIPSLLKFF